MENVIISSDDEYPAVCTKSEENIADNTMNEAIENAPKEIPRESPEILKQIPKRSVPNANVPEKIIFCMDTCHGGGERPHELSEEIPPLVILKRAVTLFMHNKQMINRRSEFALVLLNKSEPVWVCDFTRNIMKLVIALDLLDHEECDEVEFDMSKVFRLVNEHVDLPEVNSDYKLIPPINVVRLIVFYTRSNCIPKAPSGGVFELLTKHPYFTTDILYLHENSSSDNKCDQIFDSLQTLDNGYSYILQTGGDLKNVLECGAKLLAHPLQRPLQRDLSYDFIK